MPERTFTTKEVSKITGASLRQLQWWDERKVIKPRLEGHDRRYTPAQLIQSAVIVALRRKGLSLQKIRRALRLLQREIERRVGQEFVVVTNGATSWVEDAPREVLRRLHAAKDPVYVVYVSPESRNNS